VSQREYKVLTMRHFLFVFVFFSFSAEHMEDFKICGTKRVTDIQYNTSAGVGLDSISDV